MSSEGKLLLVESTYVPGIECAAEILRDFGYKVTEFPCGFIPPKIQEPTKEELVLKKSEPKTWQDIYSKED